MENISFKVCDVRSIDMFEDNPYDFRLFSFNDLDYIDHKGRMKALKEIN